MAFEARKLFEITKGAVGAGRRHNVQRTLKLGGGREEEEAAGRNGERMRREATGDVQ